MQLDIAIRKTLVTGQRRFHLQICLSSNCRRIVLLGASGAGKSLTLKAIAGLERPDTGHIRLAGRTLFDAAAGIDLSPQRRRLAYLFQDYALFPHLDVRQNIAFGLQRGWRNPSSRQRHPAVEHWLQAFGLQDVAQQRPVALSGGQQQRTALARALVAQPDALLLDEPFTALDPSLRGTLRDELDAWQRRLQVPMLLITHDAEDARRFGDEVFRIEGGRVHNDSGSAEAT